VNNSFKRKYQLDLTRRVARDTGLREPAALSKRLRTQQHRAGCAEGEYKWIFHTPSRQARKHTARITATVEVFKASCILHCIIAPDNGVQQQDPDSIPKKWRVFRERVLNPALNAGLIGGGFRVMHASYGGQIHMHLLLFTRYRMAHHDELYRQTRRGDFTGLPNELQKFVRRLELEAIACGLAGIVKVRTSLRTSPNAVAGYLMKDLGSCWKLGRKHRPRVIKNKKYVVSLRAKNAKIFRAKLFPPISIKSAQQNSMKAI